MKNKKATYTLIVLVVIIWGLIGFRIYNHIHDKDGEETELYIPIDTTAIKLDMDAITELKLNYRDPFLKYNPSVIRRSEATKQGSNRRSDIRRRIGVLNNNGPAEKKVTWPDIIFSGLILNDKTNEELGLIEVDKESFLIRKGDIKKDIIINEIYADSILVTYQDKQRTIKKTN